MQPFPDIEATDLDRSDGRILVVDDTESNRDMLSRRLERRGFTVETAKNGREALDMIRSGSFDLVLLDIMMPELNGYEVLKQMKEDEELQYIPVVMISAIDDVESVVKCLELGADDYLPKPFNPTLLRARVESTLAKKRFQDRERLYAQSLERELEIGRRIQEGFLPAELPQRPGWEIAVRFCPAKQVAGDFYDAFELTSDRIGLVMADVCGKGVGAAMFMALFRSLIRAHADRAAVSPFAPAVAILIEAISATNGYIVRMHRSAHTFASVFFGVLDPNTGVLNYLNAGHLPPIIINADGSMEHLKATGPAVGLLGNATFDVSSATILPGSTLFAFTDGVTEARDEHRAFFDEERLYDALLSGAESASELLDNIFESVREFSGDTEQADDVTMLAVRRELAAL